MKTVTLGVYQYMSGFSLKLASGICGRNTFAHSDYDPVHLILLAYCVRNYERLNQIITLKPLSCNTGEKLYAEIDKPTL